MYTDMWNVIFFCTSAASVPVIIWDIIVPGPHMYLEADLKLEIFSFPMFGHWVQVLYYMRGYKLTSQFIHLVSHILKDMAPFIIFMLIATVAFTLPLYTLLPPEHYPFMFVEVDGGRLLKGGAGDSGAGGCGTAEVLLDMSSLTLPERLYLEVKKILFIMFTAYQSAWLGGFDNDWLAGSAPEIFFFVLITLLIMVLMMNLLIAIMGSTYGRVEELGMIERNREMASLIYALERKYLSKNKEHSTEHFPGILIFAQRNTAVVKERQRQFELKIHADADNGGSVEARLMGIDDKLTAVLSRVAG